MPSDAKFEVLILFTHNLQDVTFVILLFILRYAIILSSVNERKETKHEIHI